MLVCTENRNSKASGNCYRLGFTYLYISSWQVKDDFHEPLKYLYHRKKNV